MNGFRACACERVRGGNVVFIRLVQQGIEKKKGNIS